MVESRVSQGDIEDAIRHVIGGIGDRVGRTKAPVIAIGGLIALGLAVLAFQVGRQRGHRQSAVVEVRRL